MNEGFTVFVERKIHQRMYGDQEQGLQCESGWGGLCNCVASYGPDHSFTALTPHLEDGADPDDAFSRVPYEKGFAFVCHLEQLAGPLPQSVPTGPSRRRQVGSMALRLLLRAADTRPLGGGGGGSEAKNNFVYLRNQSQISGLFTQFRVSPEDNFSDVGGWGWGWPGPRTTPPLPPGSGH